MVKPTKEDIEDLTKTTRFTKNEIVNFYRYSKKSAMTEDEFRALLKGQKGDFSDGLAKRMWAVLDADESGEVEIDELVRYLNTLLRGTQDEISTFFFDIYDVDSSKKLSRKEIREVYVDMVIALGEEAMAPETIDARIDALFEAADSNKDGEIDLDEFKSFASDENDRLQKTNNQKDHWLYVFYLFFITAFVEVGTSFGIPTLGALSSYMTGTDTITARISGITDADLGTLSGVYYVASIVGPVAGAWVMQKYNAPMALLIANLFVAVGTLIQGLAGSFATLLLGRFVLGLGGEVTAFASVESLALLFPSIFSLSAGIRNLWQSASGFLAFIVLPKLADGGNVDTAFLFPFFMALVSIVTSFLTLMAVKQKQDKTANHAKEGERNISEMFSAFTTSVVPKLTGKFSGVRQLPLAFYFCIFGIKNFYFACFSWSNFSIKFMADQYSNVDKERAAFLTGLISLIGGLTGPLFGYLSDAIGQRSFALAFFMFLNAVGYGIFAWFKDIDPIVPILLFSLAYGWGDTCSFLTIRLIASENASTGYAVYALIGNFISFLSPFFAGRLFENNGSDAMNVYFCIMALVATGFWVLIHFLMGGNKSTLALPQSKIVETTSSSINAASLTTFLAEETDKKPKASKVEANEDEMVDEDDEE